MSFETPTRLNSVQALRGFAACLVLLSHLGQIEARTSASPLLTSSSNWGNMGVDLFFVISGFIMVYITRDWLKGGLTRIPEFLFARVTRIYPLYWIVSAALLLVWWVRPDLVFSSSPNEPELLNSLFLIPAYAYPLLEVGWTLVYEMMFYILFAALLMLPLKARVWGLLALTLIVTVGYFAGLQEGSALRLHLFSPLVLEFLAGTFIGLAYLKLEGSRALGFVLAAVGLAGMLVWFGLGLPFEDQGPRVWRLTLPAAALVLGAAWLDRQTVSVPNFAIKLGDWSYSLYLTHLLTLGLIAQLWGLAGWQNAPAPLFLITSVAAAFLVAGLTYHLIEAPLIEAARTARRRVFGKDRSGTDGTR